jgi:hypothetical protein
LATGTIRDQQICEPTLTNNAGKADWWVCSAPVGVPDRVREATPSTSRDLKSSTCA